MYVQENVMYVLCYFADKLINLSCPIIRRHSRCCRLFSAFHLFYRDTLFIILKLLVGPRFYEKLSGKKKKIIWLATRVPRTSVGPDTCPTLWVHWIELKLTESSTVQVQILFITKCSTCIERRKDKCEKQTNVSWHGWLYAHRNNQMLKKDGRAGSFITSLGRFGGIKLMDYIWWGPEDN